MRCCVRSKAAFPRSDFPVLENGEIYLDSAATSLKPRKVAEILAFYYGEETGTVHRAIYTLAAKATAQYEAVRAAVARFIHAHEDEIIFTKGTTEAINLVASSFGKKFLSPGDAILITEMEHHSNIVPWQLICQERGATLLVVPMLPSGDLDMEAFKTLLDRRVKLVSVVHVSNALGTINPIEEIISLAHSANALVLVDAAQSAAHHEIDVKKLDVDFLAFSGHKMYGPTGIGILYGKKALLEELPPYQGGGDMIETVTFDKTTFQQPPLKFEAGTPPIASVLGFGAAIEYLEMHGRPQIEAYEQELLDYLLSNLPPLIKLVAQPHRRGPIVTCTFDDLHPLDVGTVLNLKKISVRTGHLCAQPALAHFGLKTALRISLAPYNTFDDIDRCLEALQECEALLR